MKTIDIKKANGALRDYAENASKEVVVVTRKGKPLAAVVGLDEVDFESLSLSTNPQFIQIIARSRARLAKEGGISAAEMRRRLGVPAARTTRKR